MPRIYLEDIYIYLEGGRRFRGESASQSLSQPATQPGHLSQSQPGFLKEITISLRKSLLPHLQRRDYGFVTFVFVVFLFIYYVFLIAWQAGWRTILY